MRRLIIIGNGFDLAHKRKTSYADFIKTYFANAVNTFFENFDYSDSLFDLGIKPDFTHFDPRPAPASVHNVIDTIKKIQLKSIDFRCNFYSILLNNTFSKIDSLNWVDLEMEYFNVLKSARKTSSGNDNALIVKLNSQFEELKKLLINYLLIEEEEFNIKLFNKSPLIDCFTEEFDKKEILLAEVNTERPDSIYFLNFNYTYTLEEYCKACNKIIPSEINYIHGDLKKYKADPIFGFGDEFNKDYLEFEEDNNNELFKHIKSFEYHKTKNYLELMRFVDSAPFQVQIYGHSCGLSDRTMLNSIFENENCKSIKIFYHERENGLNDFTDRTYEIYRHFSDKGLSRKKVVPKALSKSMPQPLII